MLKTLANSEKSFVMAGMVYFIETNVKLFYFDFFNKNMGILLHAVVGMLCTKKVMLTNVTKWVIREIARFSMFLHI